MLVHKVHYHTKSKTLDVYFDNQRNVQFSAEFLRVHSPSAEVKGHGSAKLVINKKDVEITDISQVGHYAIKLVFSDGHDNCLYSWQYLYQLAQNQTQMWQDYLAALKQHKAPRDSSIPIKFTP